MKGNLQISGRFWGGFRKIIAICYPFGTTYRMPLNEQPKREKEIKWAIRDFHAELARLRREEGILRFQPCRGDVELRRKEEALEGLKKRIKSVDEKIWELEKKLREIMSEAGLNANEFP